MEIALSIFAIVLILWYASSMSFYGLFFEMTNSLFLFFAMMVTLRYWYLGNDWIRSLTHLSGAYAAFASFWALLLVGCLPLIGLQQFINQDARPKYPKILDKALGFVFGLISASIFVSCVMTSFTVIMPKVWGSYNRDVLLVKMDEYPIKVFQFIENRWLRIDENDPRHTRFPSFQASDSEDSDQYWR